MAVLVLPFLDALARDLVQADAAPAVDFSRPAGEAALVPPDSVSWRIFKNPVALFIGGVAAVILELADPAVRTGVWEHTSFRRDPMARLRRTGLAAMVTVYGPRRSAETMIAQIARAHERVRGRTPAGEAYAASDPVLLAWVHATATFGFAGAYDRYVRPLGDAAFDRAFADGAASARLYGATAAPRSRAEAAALVDSKHDRLEASPIVFEFLDIMRRAPVLPMPLRPLQRLMIRAAIDLVPPWIRDRLGIAPALGLRPWQRPLVRLAGRLADRILLRSSPAVQSCLRLGLPADYLYR